jgi:uncharacterized membrane protein YkoI
MRKAFIPVVAGLLVVGGTAAWKVQHEKTQDALQARARVSADAARQTALAAVPGGRIVESELEEEDGRLIYSFDIEAADGTHDVEIDALTGQVLQSALENEDEDHDDEREDDEKAEHRSR